MVCKFCSKDKRTINCHIIPHALYKPLLKSGEIPKIYTNTEGVYPKKSPIGVYDEEIVCADCEKYFNDCDAYAADFFLHESHEEHVIKSRDGIAAIIVEDFDYSLLKLFGVSLLWRASASTHPFFKRVQIGPHDEIIKRMIRDQSPGGEDDYSIILSRFNMRDKASIIQDPFRTKYDGLNFYRFYFNSYCMEIKVDKRPIKGLFRSFMISPNSPLTICERDLAKSKELEIAKSILK